MWNLHCSHFSFLRAYQGSDYVFDIYWHMLRSFKKPSVLCFALVPIAEKQRVGSIPVHSSGNPRQISFSYLAPTLTSSVPPPYSTPCHFWNPSKGLQADGGVRLLAGDKTSIYRPHIWFSPFIWFWVSVWVKWDDCVTESVGAPNEAVRHSHGPYKIILTSVTGSSIWTILFLFSFNISFSWFHKIEKHPFPFVLLPHFSEVAQLICVWPKSLK